MIMTQQDERKILKKIRGIIVFFMIAIALSGITAFPIETELNTFFSVTGINSESVKDDPEIFKFLHYMPVILGRFQMLSGQILKT